MSPRRSGPADQTPAERKRALAAARQARWRHRQKARGAAALGLRTGAGDGVDVASLLHDRLAERLADDELDLLDRDVQGAMRIALTSAAIKDKRKTQLGTGDPQLAFAIIALVNGTRPAPLALPDPSVYEGEAVQLPMHDPSPEADG